MSISSIMATARSGLMSTQSAIAVTSTNIANADTEGYSAKTARLATTIVGGRATGVTVVGISTTVNEAVFAQSVKATSRAAEAETTAAYLETVSASLGSSEDGAALEDAMTSLMSALDDAIAAGGDSTSSQSLEEALETWTDTLASASASVQAARTAADEAITDAVEDINALLTTLDDLNDQIARASAQGSSTADLQDSQRVALDALAGLVDITTFTTSSGEIRVYTTGGQPLLTSTAHTLSYTPAGRLSADSTYDASGGGAIGGIVVDGADATAKLTGGSLGALVEARDETLPQVQAALDGLAVDVANAVNEAASTASPVPAPATLSGTTSVDASAPFSGSGTLYVLAVNEDGTVGESTALDLSTFSTYGDLVTALNGAAGVSATLDASGNLVLQATNSGQGVVLSGDTSVGADGFNLAHALGINCLLEGDGADTMSLSSTLESQGVPVTVAAATTVGETALVEGASDGLRAVWSALDSPIAFDAAGGLPAAERSAQARIAALIDDVADRAGHATDAADLAGDTRDSLAAQFSNSSGVNADEESAKLVALEQSYQAMTQIVSTAQTMFNSLMTMMG
ncbi:flagellar hook-associated protein FlgK [Pararhodospirillum oryzae]|uniref:Flagellar hook-associated protein 1 n=1 Tax=Pararhodospirillum oryzae TaxID=478448 RepID=A0A512H5Z0_9PROT|nr:flagellar hook-associated protein FlgK [Pararhodospirillum oryzae]GEO80844.1 flagellar hook-associated protein 1 [Pararhodospirillum oryzae]